MKTGHNMMPPNVKDASHVSREFYSDYQVLNNKASNTYSANGAKKVCDWVSLNFATGACILNWSLAIAFYLISICHWLQKMCQKKILFLNIYHTSTYCNTSPTIKVNTCILKFEVKLDVITLLTILYLQYYPRRMRGGYIVLCVCLSVHLLPN